EIGEGVVEGEIVKWLVHEGDVISADQPVAEIMTDKATIEVTTPKSGRVMNRHGAEGDIVAVHSPLLEIDDGDASPVASAPAVAPVPAPAPVPAAVAAPTVQPPAPVATPRSGKTLATPAVRSHARSAGIDIAAVPGSGKAGRVTKADIDAFVTHPGAVKAPPALPAIAFTPGEDERVRIIGLRRKIAEKMAESYRLVPHFCYVDEVDATNLVAVRRSLKATAADHGVKLTYLAFIMKALAVTFRQDEFRKLNANMDEERFELVIRGDVNIGIATDSPQGLYVPVVKNVEQKSILQLAAEVSDLTQRTREGRVSLDELQGGTFTITSVGNIGGRFATPIINHPEVAILGVNQIHDRPMVIDGEVVARKMMYLSPSFDHRVIDGAVAARFVSALKDILERPESLLLGLR
ncbi:MAG: dihydrolipoamide acetyltransferase family protein, partial [Myxococcota bacterium]|nr:dihydrolipoamide acetyltransferase family protein [Myxococcota bacterium]